MKVLGPKASLKDCYEVYKTLKSGWWTKGPKVAELEERFAKFVGKKYAVAVDSCTSALTLALRVHEVRGEVVTTPMTFASTALAPMYCGLKVRFSDIDPDNLCLDPKKLRIRPNTGAVIVVHSHGNQADIAGIRSKFKGLIIEDNAHCGGMAAEDGVCEGDIQCWSFQSVKVWPAGDGGMITTDDYEIYKKLKPMTWCGIKETTWDRETGKGYNWDYVIDSLGYKCYMNDIIATLVLSKMDRIEKMNQRRRDIAFYYDTHLDIDPCDLPACSGTYQYYTIKTEYRDQVADKLREAGISTSVHFKPLSEHPFFKRCIIDPLPVTDRVWKQLLTLPIFDGMTNRQVRYVVKKFNEIVG